MIARSSVPGEPRQGAEIGVLMELEAAAAKPIQRQGHGSSRAGWWRRMAIRHQKARALREARHRKRAASSGGHLSAGPSYLQPLVRTTRPRAIHDCRQQRMLARRFTQRNGHGPTSSGLYASCVANIATGHFGLSLDELRLLNRRAAARIVRQIVPHISRTNRKSTAHMAIS